MWLKKWCARLLPVVMLFVAMANSVDLTGDYVDLGSGNAFPGAGVNVTVACNYVSIANANVTSAPSAPGDYVSLNLVEIYVGNATPATVIPGDYVALDTTVPLVIFFSLPDTYVDITGGCLYVGRWVSETDLPSDYVALADARLQVLVFYDFTSDYANLMNARLFLTRALPNSTFTGDYVNLTNANLFLQRTAPNTSLLGDYVNLTSASIFLAKPACPHDTPSDYVDLTGAEAKAGGFKCIAFPSDYADLGSCALRTGDASCPSVYSGDYVTLEDALAGKTECEESTCPTQLCCSVVRKCALAPKSVKLMVNTTQYFSISCKDQNNEPVVCEIFDWSSNMGDVDPAFSLMGTTLNATIGGRGNITASLGDVKCFADLNVTTPGDFPRCELAVQPTGDLYKFKIDVNYWNAALPSTALPRGAVLCDPGDPGSVKICYGGGVCNAGICDGPINSSCYVFCEYSKLDFYEVSGNVTLPTQEMNCTNATVAATCIPWV